MTGSNILLFDNIGSDGGVNDGVSVNEGDDITAKEVVPKGVYGICKQGLLDCA